MCFAGSFGSFGSQIIAVCLALWGKCLSIQFSVMLSLPPINHFTSGLWKSHDNTLSHFFRQRNSSAISAQNCSGFSMLFFYLIKLAESPVHFASLVFSNLISLILCLINVNFLWSWPSFVIGLYVKMSRGLQFQIILHGFLVWASMGFLMPVGIYLQLDFQT